MLGGCAGTENRRPGPEAQGTPAFKSGQRQRSQERGMKRSVQRWRRNPRKSGVIETREERGRRKWPTGHMSQRGAADPAWWRWVAGEL